MAVSGTREPDRRIRIHKPGQSRRCCQSRGRDRESGRGSGTFSGSRSTRPDIRHSRAGGLRNRRHCPLSRTRRCGADNSSSMPHANGRASFVEALSAFRAPGKIHDVLDASAIYLLVQLKNLLPFFPESSSAFPHRESCKPRHRRAFSLTLKESTLFRSSAATSTRRL
jgi:hypothetical protein